MDSQKDPQRTDGITKFLDYQTLKSNSFGDNRVGERLYRRAERLASAIVLLTNHVHQKDILRIKARESSIDILDHVIDIRDEMRSFNSSHISDLKMSVRKTISLVRLLGVSGSVSLQNAEIVVEALDELLAFLAASRRSALSETVAMNREDFIDTRESYRPIDMRTAQAVHSVSDTQVEAPVAQGGIGQSTQSVSSRSQAILEVLRHQGEMGIRQIVSNLPEYSEKMIQRELVELVAVGRVKKTGLKRWSRYTYIESNRV